MNCNKVPTKPQITRRKITYCTFLRLSAWLMRELLSCRLFPEYTKGYIVGCIMGCGNRAICEDNRVRNVF